MKGQIMRFAHYLIGFITISYFSFDSNFANAEVVVKPPTSEFIGQATSSNKEGSKDPHSIDIKVRGYTIPVCTDSGVGLKESLVEEVIYIGSHDIDYWGKQYLGKLKRMEVTCHVTEFRTKRSNYSDFVFLLTDYLTKFKGSYLLVEGNHGAPYGLYRLVHPDKYVQYIAVYFHSAGALQLSVGSFPRNEPFIRDQLMIMMAKSGLGRPGT